MKSIFGILTLAVCLMASSAFGVNIFVHSVNNISGWDSVAYGGANPFATIRGNHHDKEQTTDGITPYEFYGSGGPEHTNQSYSFSVDGTTASNTFFFVGTNINLQITFTGAFTNTNSWGLTVDFLPDPNITNYLYNNITNWPAGHQFSVLIDDYLSFDNPFGAHLYSGTNTVVVGLSNPGEYMYQFHAPEVLYYRVYDNGHPFGPNRPINWWGFKGVIPTAQGDYNDPNNVYFTWWIQLDPDPGIPEH